MGSQFCSGHQIGVNNVVRVECSSIKVTLKSKIEFKCFARDGKKKVVKHRLDNSRHSDAVFIKNTREENQNIELCGVEAYN